MSDEVKIKWLSKPEEHDYPAALSYLSLIYNAKKAVAFVSKLKRAPIAEFKAKDIFRASKLPLLGISNERFKRDEKKIQTGKELSPILLVRDRTNGKVIIADGYHRLCAVYSHDEDAIIPCKMV